MNRTTVLVVGLLSMAVFAILCVRHNVAAIQDDMRLRAEQLLSEVDAGWADVSISGRDVSLGGIAPSAAARDRATGALAAMRGLRILTDQSVLSSQAAGASTPPSSLPADQPDADAAPVVTARARTSDGPYWFSITRSGRGVTLEGLMPDQRSREALVTLARRRVGNDPVRDLLQVQSGSPPGWHNVTTAALVLSGTLVEGEVAVRGRSVFVRGLTSSDATADEVRNGLATALPEGYGGQAEVQSAARLTEVLRTAPGAAARLADRRAAAEREAAAAATTAPSVSQDVPSPDTPVAAVPAQPGQTGAGELSGTRCQAQFNDLLANERILFETASHVIDSRSGVLLDKLAAVAAQCPRVRIEIGGHTDDQGTESNNLALSQRRAEAVLQYLATRGIDLSRMTARGYGESRPLVRNRTAEHRARNRRIEIKIIEDD